MVKEPFNLRELLEPAIHALGCELVGVEYHSSGRHSVLRIYIDRPEGVTLDDCQAISHQVSGILDVEDPVPGQYTLEVSSPGLDRPLFRREDFERFSGEAVQLRMQVPVEGRRRFSGTLRGLADDAVVIELDDGGEVRLPLEQVEQARLRPEW